MLRSVTMVTAWWVLGLVLGTMGVHAGFLDVQMEPATQCGHSIVQWSGDEGPYHLLLTPTEHQMHGYNVWLPSLPNGTNSYNLTIRQPEGLQFVLTMWGASGISYAGTTDILTVGPPTTNASCFLTDQQILGLYSFSFNINDTSNGYPPQCSNMTMSWPTSLESNVTGPIAKRIDEELDDVIEELVGGPAEINNLAPTGSSSESQGNTTYPPSMFGVIPLGNSFSIPITYDWDSRYAKYLPDSSKSDNPTTWTRQGVTYLNWTVPLAKGTRFILVAGIGSDQQWASGGSSALLTVGQGTTQCGWQDSDDNAPSVTATTGTYTGDTETGGAQTGGAQTGTTGSTEDNNGSSVVRTVLACVLSIVGTLIVVGLLFFCLRARRRRREMISPLPKYPDGMGKLNRTATDPFNPNPSSTDMPLDLIASRDGSRGFAPILTGTPDRADSPGQLSPVELSPVGTVDSRRRMLIGMSPHHTDPRTATATSYDSPISPSHGRPPFHEDLGRQSSLDPLLARSGTMSPVYSPAGVDTFGSGTGTGTASGTVSTGRPLMLHDRTTGLPYERSEEEDEDLPELKRETLALNESQAAQPGTSGRRATGVGAAGGRRRRRDEELEYVVHRDAGRVQPPQQEEGRRVLELPPRYEELDWDELEQRHREEEREGETPR